MQIREKGKQILCIVTEYDKVKKRTYGKTVARQDKGLSIISYEVEQALTSEQFLELKGWLTDRTLEEEKDGLFKSLSIVGETLEKAGKCLAWFPSAELDNTQIEEIIESLDVFKKALRKRNIKITKQTKKKSVQKKADDKQIDLDSDA